jgi:hypothetical protein
MLSDATRLSWNPQVATRTLDGTSYILLEGRFISLNEVGSRIWTLFERGSTVGAVATTIVDEFDADAATVSGDVRRFVALLSERKMLLELADKG